MTWKSNGYRAILIILFLFLSALFIINLNFNRMRYTRIPRDDESLGIKKEDMQENGSGDKTGTVPRTDANNQAKISDDNNHGANTAGGGKPKEEANDNPNGDGEYKGRSNKITNIVLLGGDRRYKNEASHTDAVMVLTIDGIHNKVKISSIMRDTYVSVHGHGKTKLTHAYAYGGPVLAIRTLNENFRLNIRNFVFIDFNGFEKLVDSLGGVEIDVKQYEIRETNKYIREIASIKKQRYTPVKKAGMQRLNGQQALAYSRIRYVGNGDYERTERQRRVLAAIFEKVKSAGPLRYPSIAANILPYVETNMSKTDIIKMGMYIFSSDISNIEEKRFPMDGYYKGKVIDKVWYIVTDINTTRRQMQKFIYEK